jgi:hypothetical protein
MEKSPSPLFFLGSEVSPETPISEPRVEIIRNICNPFSPSFINSKLSYLYNLVSTHPFILNTIKLEKEEKK